MLVELMLSPWIFASRVLAAQADYLENARRPRTAEIIPFPRKFRRRNPDQPGAPQ